MSAQSLARKLEQMMEQNITATPGTQGSGAPGIYQLLAGLFAESATDSITAFAGGGQTSATLLTTELNRVTTVATAADSIKLPASVKGTTIMVVNHAANSMQVFGSGTDTINDVATATGVPHMPNSTVIYSCYTAGAWYTEGLATGFASGFQTMSTINGLTAHAGGGQGSALPLTAMINRVTTVGTAADSVILPASVAGMQITVINAAAANSMNVFPATGDAINALSANTAFAVAANKTATFTCPVAGTWHSILTA